MTSLMAKHLTQQRNASFLKLTISPLEGLISLISTYYAFYVGYPKSPPAAGLLLFIQEVPLDQTEEKQKKTAKYNYTTSKCCSFRLIVVCMHRSENLT